MNTDVDALLASYESRLMSLARRLYVMEAFKEELNRVTKLKEFRIRNDITWRMALDMRDVCVIHLASWAKETYEAGSLIGELQAKHTQAFPRTRPPEQRDNDAGWRDHRDREHSESYKRLFACTCEPFPTPPAFIALRERFAERMKPVVDDRNANRAHPYEKGNKASPKMLDLTELREAVTYSETFLRDLRMVTSGSWMDYRDMNSVPSSNAARDLVDMLLLGTSDRIALFRGSTDRDAFYEELHRRHDAGSEEEPDLRLRNRQVLQRSPAAPFGALAGCDSGQDPVGQAAAATKHPVVRAASVRPLDSARWRSATAARTTPRSSTPGETPFAVALCGLSARSLRTNQRCAIPCAGCLTGIGRRLSERHRGSTPRPA